MIRIYQPTASGEVLKGKFMYFASFWFTDEEETWLPVLLVDDLPESTGQAGGQLVALPSHHQILETFKSNIERLEEAKTEVEVRFKNGLTLENGRMMYEYEIFFDGVPVLDRRTLTLAEIKQKFLKA